jgi:hypothetical protein
MNTSTSPVPREGARSPLDQRLETIGWALFLIMIGALVLWESSPEGLWLIGTGVIMLGLNATRYLNGIPTSTFTIGLGVLAVLLGGAELVGADLPVFPLLLILIGAHILYRTLVTTRDGA